MSQPHTSSSPGDRESIDWSRFSGARTAITGGLGFIGSSLARALVQLGADVLLIDSLVPEYGGNVHNIADIESEVRINIADIRDPFSMDHLVQGVDYLFNLAGQTSHVNSMTDPQRALSINAHAQLSVLEACRKHNRAITIVFASTRQLYGRPVQLPVNERHPPRPVDVNGINKLAGEWYHILYHEVHEIPTCCLRLTNTYGPGMRVKDARQTFLGIWIKKVLTGDPITIFGDGSQLRDFTYVEDCVDAFLRAALSSEAHGLALNIGGPDRISLRDLADLLVRINGSGSTEHMPFPNDLKAIDIGSFYVDDRQARSILCWQPRVSLENGLARTIAYYREFDEYYFD